MEVALHVAGMHSRVAAVLADREGCQRQLSSISCSYHRHVINTCCLAVCVSKARM